MPRTTNRGRRLGFLLLLLGLFAVFGATSPALAEQPADPGANAPGQTGDGPAGNNGVIKVDGSPLDDATGPDAENSPGRSHRDNEPRVGQCFNVDWYGFEGGGATSDVSFELLGPNKQYNLNVTGPDPTLENDGQGNADDQDKTQSYDLRAALTAAEGSGAGEFGQGFLVKVTAETDDLSHGASRKSKVFWVTDDVSNCISTQSCPNCPLLLLGTEITTTTTTTTTTTAPQIAGVVEEATTVPLAVLGVQLARTGAPARTLMMISGLALVLGGALLIAGKERAEAR